MTKEHLIAAAAVVVALLVGFYIHGTQPQTGGDFAGGIVPGQLLTGSASGGLQGSGYVQPVGSLAVGASYGITVGGTDQYHGYTAIVTASGTPAAVASLGAFGTSTSSATTSVTISETAGLSLGAICKASLNTSTVGVSACTLASTNGATGTATVAFTNLTSAGVSVPTSTVVRVSFEQLPY